MEKILLAIDAMKPDIKSLDFACYLANLTHSKITGIFLENLVSVENPEKIFPEMRSGQIVTADNYSVIEQKETCCEENINRFNEACGKRGVKHTIHRDRGVPAEEMIEESRFADMIIIDAETSFTKRYEGAPTKFVKEVLENAECPVIISPVDFNGINEIVFTYDGSRSSAFAIKQFTYLLPELKDKKITILQVNKENNKIIREKYKLKEWLKGHYSNIGFTLLEGDPKFELFTYLLNKRNIFVVMGAYGRNLLSHFFNRSHAELVVMVIDKPVFIAHY